MLSNMSRTAYAVFLVSLFVVTFLTSCFLMAGGAGAATIEEADRSVDRVEVTYVEDVPTHRFPARTYFETNDGAAYRYGTYGQCTRANAVPDRICRTVFWYAR